MARGLADARTPALDYYPVPKGRLAQERRACTRATSERRTMTKDRIAEISIDREGRLCVRPVSAEFPHIYREAMEVTWDTARRSLRSPVPRGWTYEHWFQQILDAVRQQGVELVIDESTRWSNADSLRIGRAANADRDRAG